MPRFASLLLAAAAAAATSQELSFDIVVYGASPAGIAAAITAANGTGLTVALLEPTPYVGGMAGPGGIGLRDTASPAAAVTGGPRSVMEAYLRLISAAYPGSPPVRQPDANISMAAWEALVASPAYNITLARSTALEEAPGAVAVSGGAITAIRTVDVSNPASPVTTWKAKFFIDASYEADVLMASGASYTIGREPRSKYNESIGGVLPNPAFQRFRATVSPYWPNGSLVDGVEPAANLPAAGAGDDRVMPSSFRACITDDPALRVPWPRPQGYEESKFELLLRLAEALPPTTTFSSLVGVLPYYGYPKDRPMKYDLCEGSELSTDQPSRLYTEYALGNRSVRAGVRQQVLDWVAGWAYTLANAQRVPATLRASAASWGLCGDAFATSGHWPLQMYVREGVRLVGDRVATQVNTVTGQCQPDSIALGAWSIDIHLMRRFAGVRGGQPATENEGEVGFQGFPGVGTVYELPLSVILPKRAEVTNLAAPVTPSASHVAFGSIRVEPIFLALGTAAGAACAVAAQAGQAVLQDVSIAAVQAALQGVSQCVHWDHAAGVCASACA